MEVRLAFSLAIQAHAEILMMDEVLAVGDLKFQQKCFEVFKGYKREGRTVVLVTHELGAVNQYCDRALLLDHGRLAGDGPAVDITAQYRRAIGIYEGGAELERRGTRDAVLTGARMLDERGLEDKAPLNGSFTRVELGYRIQNDAVTDFTCVIWLYRGDGVMVSEALLPMSQYAEVGASQRGASGTIRYDIPELPLLGGDYSITIELRGRRDAVTYDHVDHAIRFRVVDRVGRQGLVDPGGVWSVVASEIPAMSWPDPLASPR
jgi:hypothetical protein